LSPAVSIRTEALSKQYRIGTLHRGADTLRDAISGWARRTAARNTPRADRVDTIWALRDVSLEVQEGEVLGIVGRNGAGKSTLLSILSRITEPTEGRAEIRGRVGSLLEIATGFHPELTGRQNIFLNGAILGMRRAEIASKFDEIVAFADVEQFLETPVKRYSSGMYLRLAFAVAAHLDTDLLLVDEVLAVGDLEFQKKCLGKMSDVANSGRTVLFVSHQLNAVRRLCPRTIWIDGGRLKLDGPTANVLGAYEAHVTLPRDDRELPRGQAAQFLAWELEPQGSEPNVLTSRGPVTVKIRVHLARPVERARTGLALRNADQTLVGSWAFYDLDLPAGDHVFSYSVDGLPLVPGAYQWHVSLLDEEKMLDDWYAVPELVIATELFSHPNDQYRGILNIPCALEISPGG
jgi:lipopolysaccharide transport system ATP-binding protein